MVHVYAQQISVFAFYKPGSYQRCFPQIKRLYECLFQFSCGGLCVLQEYELRLRMLQYLLHRLPVRHKKPRPQNLMTADHLLKGFPDSLRLHLSGKMHALRHVIQNAIRIHLADQVGSLLRGRHGIILFLLRRGNRNILLYALFCD